MQFSSRSNLLDNLYIIVFSGDNTHIEIPSEPQLPAPVWFGNSACCTAVLLALPPAVILGIPFTSLVFLVSHSSSFFASSFSETLSFGFLKEHLWEILYVSNAFLLSLYLLD